MLQQGMVEFGAPYLIGILRHSIPRVGERKGLTRLMFGRVKLHRMLDKPHFFDRRCATHLLKQGQAHRQQRLADMKARMPILFQQQYAPALLHQQRTGRAAARTTTDDHDVGAQFVDAFVDSRWQRALCVDLLRSRVRSCKHGRASVSIGPPRMTRIRPFCLPSTSWPTP